jgi:hypothetical protein
MSASRLLTSFAMSLMLLTALCGAGAVRAQDDISPEDTSSAAPSHLTVFPMETQIVGQPIIVTAQLIGREGRAQPNKVLIIYLDGERIRRVRTDTDGTASVRIGTDLVPGEHVVLVEYEGTEAYLPTMTRSTIRVRPAIVTIQTVPPLPNITFELNGQLFTSDSEGRARIEVSAPGTYPLEATLPDDTEVLPGVQATFDRWSEAFQPERTVEVEGDVSLAAGFAISHPVGQTFIDLDGNPVAQERIETITLKGSDGSYFTYPDGEERWLQARRVVRRRSGLEAARIQYSVESIIIDGSNVVNQYQQRFYLESRDSWEIQLLLYHADIRAFDAIFGFPVGTGISVEYPNGRIDNLMFDDTQSIHIGPVARGVYSIQVTGVSGMATKTPVALSRNQNVELKVLTALDIGLGMGLGVIGALGLLLIGRPNLPRHIAQRAVAITSMVFSIGRRKLPTPTQSSPETQQQPVGGD